MPSLVSAPEAVTVDWLDSVLHESGDLAAAHVTGFGARSVGTGQVGENVRFTLEYDSEAQGAPASVVIKFPSLDAKSRATAVAQGIYRKEVSFYREIAATVGIRTPRCLFADIDLASQDFVLVMEDLAPALQGDQIRGCSVEQASIALDELAKLHAPRWGDPKLAEVSWLGRREPGGGQLLQAIYQSVWPGFVERFGSRLDAEQLALAEQLGAGLAAWVDGGEGPLTVTHGDYRLDNMLFGSGEAAFPLAVVDWQTVGHGVGTADAAYFLGAGLPLEVRRREELALMREYHRKLEAAGVKGYDWDACWLDYRRYAFSGVLMAVVASMIVGESERGDEMFAAMATRHTAHALDHDSLEFLRR
jgi:hypothetical protein